MRSPSRTTYRAGNAWFICDRCSQRRRRSALQTEWTGLKVCAPCEDPRPPQMTPPDIYPEGLPFTDARSPQDMGDLVQDDSTLQATDGGEFVQLGGLFTLPNGQAQPLGAISPQTVVENPIPEYVPGQVLQDVAVKSGRVVARDARDSSTDWPAISPTRTG